MRFIHILTLTVIAATTTLAMSDERSSEFFETKVHPLLTAKCYECHHNAEKGGLRLDSRHGLLTGGDSGPAILPGRPEDSLLIQAVRRTDPNLEMPPSEPLSPTEVGYLEQWVASGAPWSGPATSAAREFQLTPEHRSFWSFQPLASAQPPAVGPDVDNTVDAFIQAKLKQRGLQQGQPASKRTLIRRVTYDLIGLPPSEAEIASFLADESPDAFTCLVEGLLASRHYGERWGRHWLDLVRYADTAGDAADFPVPEAYKYRNYVIDSFNSDAPYDQFICEQIAGDLLPYDDDNQRWRQQIATGYLAISRRIGVSPHGLRHITIEDTINNLGKTFLGLTIGCARCHDHKFDPIPTADYYALYGIFDSSIYPHAGAEHKPYRENFVYRIGSEAADEILVPHRERIAPVTRMERAKFEEYRALQRMDVTKAKKGRAELWAEVQELRRQRGEIGKTFPELEIAYAVREGDPHDVHIHQAGEPKAHGALVRRGFLQILGGQRLDDASTGSGRLELANWISDSNNPLTARVMVNRIWHYHFGRGLVKTTSDFGIRGATPTHPELLDYLAQRFIEEGWSIKQMHRLMLSSRTYQLSSRDVPANSKIDPDNEGYWRANRRRLDAEQIRDSILSFSGELDLEPGSEHPFPHPMTFFYRQHEPFQETYETNKRSIYMLQQRIRKNPYLDLFDGPDGNIQFAERRATTTTLQALYLMNSETLHQRSRRIAQRLLAAGATTGERVDWAYRTIFGRPAREHEVARASAYLSLVPAIELDAWAGYVRGMISSNEFMFVD